MGCEAGRSSRGLPTLPNLCAPGFDVPPPGTPRIAVIVPARNESANIRKCIRSLLAQDYPNLRIVAVDDRSTDDTGAILDALCAEDTSSRLHTMHIESLPPDWLGKTHAMAVAAAHALSDERVDYLLFTDAGIEFTPDAIRRSLAAAIHTQADHFVTLPTTIALDAGEAVLLSFLQVIGMWAFRTWRVADPAAKRDSIGVGAFNLLRSDVYRAVGGFEALRLEVLDDLMLGRRVKRMGFRQIVAVAPGMVSVHWARGLRGIVRGMTKNTFAVFEYRPAVLLAAASAISLLCIGPPILLGHAATRWPAAIAWAAVAGLYALSSRDNRLPVWCAVFMPVGAILVVYAMLRSMAVVLVQGGVTWRGTFYPLSHLRPRRALPVGTDSGDGD